MEKGCPPGGSPGPQMSARPESGHPPAPHTQHKQRASFCPPAAFTANAVLTSPLPLKAHVIFGPRSHGGGGQVGGPGGGVGGRGRRCSVTSHGYPLGRRPGRRKGCLAGTFLSFISRFFWYLNLQICIIQGQPIKEEYNGAPRESRVCVQAGGLEMELFLQVLS